MSDSLIVKHTINRRAFLAGATAVGAATLAGCAEQSQGNADIKAGSPEFERVGISEAAYKKSWQRREN